MNKTQSIFIFIGIGVLILVGYLLLKPSPETKPATTANDNHSSQPSAITDTKTIVMTVNGFEPSEITIQKNTKVIFKNQDNVSRWPASAPHPTHTNYPEFDPKKGIEPGQEWGFVFEKAGPWSFHDHLNPSLRGKVTVTDSLFEPNAQQTSDAVEAAFNFTSSGYQAKSVTVKQGQKVVLKVTSDIADQVHLHGYDLSKEVAPGQEAVIEFAADKTGRFDLELEKSDKALGVVEVYPK